MIRFVDVCFTHSDAGEPLFENVSLQFDAGWTGLVGTNGSGKTTLLRLAAGELEPDAGHVLRKGRAAFCRQRTDFRPDGWETFSAAVDADAALLKGVLGIRPNWWDRWETLSHGERKRAQIAVALWEEPEILLVDEPTNHLDGESGTMVREALASFRGIGILVSHDRRLLDDICVNIVFIEPPGVLVIPGNYSDAAEQKALGEEHQRRQRSAAKDELSKLRREAARRQAEAARSVHRLSKRHLHRNDSDGRGKLDLARLTGKDAIAGNFARQLRNRVVRTEEKLDSIGFKKEYDLAYHIDGERSHRDVLLRLGQGVLPLGPTETLAFPGLVVGPSDRIGLSGPNGTGKSSFVRHLLGRLILPPERVVYLPQEIPVDEGERLIREVRSLSADELGRVLAFVSCLGTRPERLLRGDLPSPGEIRKILLALGIARRPHLIVMDEPTNHLDLPAIELLERALRDFPGALILVSHDTRFLDALATARWRFERTAGGARMEKS
ncbi:MAG TPA: ATP-binding cassette domain-containing protein [Candidatus Ozemobacteraceae bacterium]|nr:ATP-binding cassette domain-containing protein [Candidatus Ozemobacteraceae bacterium]HQG28437.1 ATP-binding cassette domain-containing protein [Candidatus Ozemobacteraceae bacterium]